jgi:type II secretory pathway component HofQ
VASLVGAAVAAEVTTDADVAVGATAEGAVDDVEGSHEADVWHGTEEELQQKVEEAIDIANTLQAQGNFDEVNVNVHVNVNANVNAHVTVFSLGLSIATEEQQIYSAIWDMPMLQWC